MTFRPVVGWEGIYEVSESGSVRRLRGSRTIRLRPLPNRRGHLRVMLHHGERRVHAYVHTLVAEAFIGPRPDGLLDCHRDDRKRNNRAENLYYGTRSDNARDAIVNGRGRWSSRRRVEK